MSLFGLLEMGSNSLKLYLVPRPTSDSAVETIKTPWRVAHDLYATGALSPETQDDVVRAIREAQQALTTRGATGTLAIATGVFRELPDLDALSARLLSETGVRPRVISGKDEAALMARGFRELRIPAPAVMCDLGGSSLEWAWISESGAVQSGSLPLGAIRNEYRFAHLRADADAYFAESEKHCDWLLGTLPVTGTPRVVATGGTAEALASIFQRDFVRATEIHDLARRVFAQGAPPDLKPARRAVLLPGLVVLSRVVVRCGAGGLAYGTSAVRLGMVRRLIQLLDRFAPGDLHATQLLGVTRHER